MLTIEEIFEIMGCNPDEIIECDDGFIMEWSPNEEESLEQ